MTPEEYDKEIARIRALIASKNSSIASLTNQGTAWIQDAAKTSNCTGTAKKKKACQDENARKISVGQGYINQANAIKSEVTSLEKQLNDLIAARAQAALTANEVSKVLASQGTTESALDILAEKTGQAQVEAANIQAAATAKAIEKQAEADASNKKKVGFIIAGIAIVVVTVVAIILYKKFKK